MSRIGKLPIPLPSAVKVDVKGVHVTVQGPKGKLERVLHPAVSVKMVTEDGKSQLIVERKGNDRLARSMHGLARTLLANMVKGVQEPYKQSLEVSGVGYRAELQGKSLKIQCGFSHDVLHPIPQGVDVTVDKMLFIHLSSPDKELLGKTASEIRAYKPCEPYKGKGIKYAGEIVRRKEGKTGAG